jgi:FkbM family methyltransferase
MNLDEWFDRTASVANGVIAAVLEHLPVGGSLYDVGANVGAVTSAALAANRRVAAFEPHPVYREYLERRCPEAKVYPYALGATFGTAMLFCDKTNNPGWNTFIPERTDADMELMEVEVRPLDSLETSMSVLKIDVEGYEAQVIEGAAQTIQRCHPAIVMELGWGVNHPNWKGQVAMMEWLFSEGYQRIPYEFETTTDVVLHT